MSTKTAGLLWSLTNITLLHFMKAILIDGAIHVYDEAEHMQRRHEVLQKYGITDDVIASIQTKDLTELTDTDLQLIRARQQFDNDWQKLQEQFANAKPVIFAPTPKHMPMRLCERLYTDRGDNIVCDWRITDMHTPFVQRAIDELKAKLASTDYVIVKTYEARILDEPEPYANLTDIVHERKALRERINELEVCEKDIVTYARVDM